MSLSTELNEEELFVFRLSAGLENGITYGPKRIAAIMNFGKEKIEGVGDASTSNVKSILRKVRRSLRKHPMLRKLIDSYDAAQDE